jgi:hypothetical protein
MVGYFAVSSHQKPLCLGSIAGDGGWGSEVRTRRNGNATLRGSRERGLAGADWRADARLQNHLRNLLWSTPERPRHDST